MKNQNKPLKVLHMAPLGCGGISKLTVSINGLINLDNVMFDYLVFKNEKTFYENIINQYKAQKKLVDVAAYNEKKLLLYWKKYQLTKKMLLDNRYDVVHVNASTPMDIIIGMAAKSAGVKVRVIHSHIAGDNKSSFVRNIYLSVCRRLMPYIFTDFFAISDSAAKFMFPKKILKSQKYLIVKNGIEAEQYKYDNYLRNKVRKELGIENAFVIGHVGRFSEEKNHSFIIDVFEQLIKKQPNAILLLIGDGKLKKNIKEIVRMKGLTTKVIFYGTSHEIPKLMMAMDSFIFPSRYEGLGIAVIEAQCSGLPVFCSTGIPRLAKCAPVFHYVKSDNAMVWADFIIKNKEQKRKDYITLVKEAGFDLKRTADFIEEFYIQRSST